jgi:endonuclease/exonuclease/phosphatase family metal-dependent hydrolase
MKIDNPGPTRHSPAMRSALLAAILMLIPPAADASPFRVATFNIGARFTTDGIEYSLNAPGTTDHETVKDILRRMDADVVTLQEVFSGDTSGTPSHLDALAAALGYPHQHRAPFQTLDFSLRVVFLSRFPFLSTGQIQSPQGANELVRRFPVVRVDVPGTAADPLLIAGHLKSGTTTTDRFRRAIEMRRLAEYVEGPALAGIENWVILGDFNLSSIQTEFQSLPSNLPGTYSLGADVTFPVTYRTDPISYFNARLPVRLDPRQLDGSPSTFNTLQPGGPAIDLVMISPALARRPVWPEIYNSALDFSGLSGLPKSGGPLPAPTSAVASDHYAIFADLQLEPSATHDFTEPGATVTEDFRGFLGVAAPERWTTSGGSWLGRDDGRSAEPGFRSYGAIHSGSLGILPGDTPATATVAFRNQSTRPVTALRVSLSAEVRRAVENGSADGFAVELLAGTKVIPLPELAWAAGDTEMRTGLAAGLAIPPGGDFHLRFTFTRGPAEVPPADIFINEFHYDNSGADVGEFVEVVVGPGFTGKLEDISLVLYNGGNGQTYDVARPLSSFVAGAVTPSGHRFHHIAVPGLQNGSPDGFALVHGNTVLQFLSYEGTFTATNGPAAGTSSTDTGVSQTGTEPIGEASLGLTGNGSSARDFRWAKFSNLPHSPGQPNPGQTFSNFLAPQGISLNRLAVTFLAEDQDSDGDGIADAAEAVFGTDPFDPASRYQIRIIRLAGGSHRLSYPTLPGRRYTVQTSVDLIQWHDRTPVEGDGLPRTVDIPDDPENGRTFLRVRAEVP